MRSSWLTSFNTQKEPSMPNDAVTEQECFQVPFGLMEQLCAMLRTCCGGGADNGTGFNTLQM